MILILSFEDFELGTNPVVDWLLYKKANFVRLSIKDLVNKSFHYSIRVDKNTIEFNHQAFDLKDIHVVWLRRWMAKDLFKAEIKNGNDLQALNESINEIKKLSEYLFDCLSDKQWLLTPEATKLNKLHILRHASSCGLNTPHSVVLNNREDLLEFHKSSPDGIISKPIEHSDYFVNENSTFSVYTKEITEEDVNALPLTFFPTFFQEKVKKQYELRIFYLDGVLSSSAFINSDSHHIDIKLDSNGKWVPYQLSGSVESSIKKFMQAIDMNTGSIDMMKNEAGDYVFIEVNPAGQYLETSLLCGHQIERQIANWLIDKDHG